jgi:P4 family phage/plasmid primase-like protien
METSIVKILHKNTADGVFHTHVSMVQPTGKYQFNRQGIEELWKEYCNILNKKDDPILGIAEKPNHNYLPVLVDIDIKIKESEDTDLEQHLYTENHVKKVIEIYQSVLRNIVDDCKDIDLTCVLLEKQCYRITQGNFSYVKNGFHLHFPYLFLNKVDQEIHLIPRVQDLIQSEKVFFDLGFENSADLVDKSCCKVPWLLYGSRKKEDMEPYKLTKIYDSECNEISLDNAFKYYQLYDEQEKLINIKGKIKYFLPRILSIHPYGRNTKEIKSGIISPLKEKIKEKKKIKQNNNKLNSNEALKLSSELLPLLADWRADDRNEWMTIGWILYNIGDGEHEALEQWLDFSSRSVEKFDENICIYEWERMTKRDLTIGTLKYYASVDNPDGYKEFKKKQSEIHAKNSLNGSHNDIAKMLYTQYGNEFVCASVVNKIWYQFKNHKWEEIEEGIFLRERISDEIVQQFVDMGKQAFESKGNVNDKGMEVFHDSKIKQINKMINNLKSAPYKNNIMKECMEVFYNKGFKDKLNKNPYLICFKNGVYDLKLNIFRSGKPEDYISKSMPINYIDFNNEDDKVKAVYDYLEKVFPDKSLRSYFMDQSSDIFVGGNNQKIVLFWTGEGDNAKSVTQTIFEKMLGELAIKFDTKLITGKKVDIGGANPELARAGEGIRWAVLEEPNADEQINIGVLKNLSGNDSYWARDLFEKGKSTKEMTPMFKLVFICNKLPNIKYSDKAVWNRVRVIPFESTFVRPGDHCPDTYEEQLQQKRFPMDPYFSQKIPDLLEPFAWILLEHRKNITIRIEPEKVKSATNMYRQQNDIYRQFVEECIINDPHSSISLIEIYSQFKDWFKEGFPGQTIPVKNHIKDYFSKLWNEPSSLNKWKGFRIRTIKDDIDNGICIPLDDNDLVSYNNNGAPPI